MAQRGWLGERSEAGGGGPELMLNRVHHVGVAVRHADDALVLFQDTLGLPVTKDAVLEQQGVRGVLLAAGETEVELLEPLSADTPVGRFLSSRGEGLHHLCFGTDDVEAELATARERGLPLIDERPRPGLAGMIAFLHPRATCSVLVEFAQPPELPSEITPVPENELTVRAFDHIVVAVQHRDRGVETFSRNFDLSEDTRADLPQRGMQIASLPIGASFVEIVSPMSDGSPIASFLSRRGEGLYLLSLSVADLDQAAAGLQRRSIRFDLPAEQNPPARWGLIPPRSACGALLQLIERHT